MAKVVLFWLSKNDIYARTTESSSDDKDENENDDCHGNFDDDDGENYHYHKNITRWKTKLSG